MTDANKPDEHKTEDKKGDNRKRESDIFISNSIFPDAESIFTFELQPLDAIKDKCIVVVDTNALLVPYTISKNSLDAIKSIYGKLVKESRLVIPGQVAREFAKNKVTKLTELYDKLSKKKEMQLETIKSYPLLESYSEYQDLLRKGEEIENLFEEYKKQIGKIKDIVKGWGWNDPVSLIYRELFSKDIVIDLLLDQNKQKEIGDNLTYRQKYKIPPGYKDAGKEDAGIGDLVIWHTILSVGQEKKQPVCFVSGDEKADWYNRSNNQALYPRHELIDEFRRCSDGQSFHMINFSRFLNLFGASDSVVEEVKAEEQQTPVISALFEDEEDYPLEYAYNMQSLEVGNLRSAIYEWLKRQSYKQLSDRPQYQNSQIADYLLVKPNDEEVFVYTAFLDKADMNRLEIGINNTLNLAIGRLTLLPHRAKKPKILILVVTREQFIFKKVLSESEGFSNSLVQVILALIDNNDQISSTAEL